MWDITQFEEGAERRKSSRKENMNYGSIPPHLHFTAYDALPFPGNLKKSHEEYPTWPHYPPLTNLKHSLGYGRQRLLQLGGKPSDAVPYSCYGDQMIGHQFQARTSDPCPLGGVLNWWLVKLSQRLCFPPEIATANLRLDLLLSCSHFHRFV